jgi:hypothetical protein
MGRRIRKSDIYGDLEQMLRLCLDRADESGLPMTAIHISAALDHCQSERVQRQSTTLVIGQLHNSRLVAGQPAGVASAAGPNCSARESMSS